ncbi:MAG: cytochrome c biogenesis protein CcsA [Phycisphaerales bacterium]|nr:cytochrome c biogenesis protein CcsA [Phycisphaerales bacterium]
MTKRLIAFVFGVALVVAIASLAVGMLLRSSRGSGVGFFAELDLRPLDQMAVSHEGRLKSYESFATEYVGLICGHARPGGLAPDAMLMDMMIRPDRYVDADVIYIKKKPMRVQLAAALARASDAGGAPGIDDARARAIVETGLVSLALLADDRAQVVLDRWALDLVRTAKAAGQIEAARQLMRPEVIADALKFVPPPGGDPHTPWLHAGELFRSAPDDARAPIPLAQKAQLRGSWESLVRTWRAEDAAGVNAAVRDLAAPLASMSPTLYPSKRRLAWESAYFTLKHLTWVWVCYVIAVVFLLMGVVYRWDVAWAVGFGAFLASFGLHTCAVGLRWWVSGRWPNANMFEAVTTAVWMGALVGLLFELLARKGALRGVFALCGASAGMVAMMSAHFIPELDGNIRNMMPVLHDLWLYIHTNVIIASYALIFMSAVTAGLYLVRRALGGSADFAQAGGAALLIDQQPTDAAGISKGAVLDGATMVLIELAFIMLWAGIGMGAIWADHSWGRPWGWDPKEVFALNTFLVFLVLLHVRFKVRDKGLWTAVLALVGCGVMLFNWVVINFVIAGLHSYA